MAKEPRNGVEICFAVEGKTFLHPKAISPRQPDNNVAPPINIFLSVDLSAAGNLVNDASIVTGTKADWQATAFEVIDTGYTSGNNPLYNLTIPGGKGGSEVYLFAEGDNGKYNLTLKDRDFVNSNKDNARFTILPA
ncbi:hypothetical protein ONZ45_g14810 [Pleurotus djamor]|nr:hypothetical protein ONZ45_g14810 [Pleurotus djamor]